MVSRYGEFVLYRPRWNGHTALLWLAPILLLVGGFLVLYGVLRRTPQAIGEEVGSGVDEQRLQALLQESEQESRRND
jgi:cytochrome c-type biogenesis protein CcmH